MESRESTLQFTGPQSQADIQVTRIEHSRGWVSLKLWDLWEYRELIYFLIWRDIKVRYKQTVIGAAWAVVQPLMTMIVFTVIFGNFAKIPSDGLPYPIFAYTALLPWNLFAGALQRSSTSVVGSSHLISKVYFPRLIVPLAANFSGIVDFVIGFLILLGLMFWFGIGLTWGLLTLPIFLLLTVLTALAVGLWFAALDAKYRDVGYAVPFLVQIWMYASPVAYPVSLVPEKWRLLYSLNPMVGVIEGFRWALLGKESPDFGAIALSTIVMSAILIGGVCFFKRMERSFADLV